MNDEWTKEATPARLRALCAALGRRRVDLAKLLKVSPVTVSRWANGHNAPDARSADALSRLEAFAGSRKG